MNDSAAMPWQQALTEHFKQCDPAERYFQMASVDQTGTVHNRTLVCRGIDAERNALFAVTDAGSAKIEQLNSAIALCWYIPSLRHQYQLMAHAKVNNEPIIRKDYWQRLSTQAQTPFVVAHSTQDNAIPESFCVLEFVVFEVHWLDVSQWPHPHYVWQQD